MGPILSYTGTRTGFFINLGGYVIILLTQLRNDTEKNWWIRLKSRDVLPKLLCICLTQVTQQTSSWVPYTPWLGGHWPRWKWNKILFCNITYNIPSLYIVKDASFPIHRFAIYLYHFKGPLGFKTVLHTSGLWRLLPRSKFWGLQCVPR